MSTIRDQVLSANARYASTFVHPLVPSDIPIHGYVYQVESGRLVEVAAATEIGRAHGAR